MFITQLFPIISYKQKIRYHLINNLWAICLASWPEKYSMFIKYNFSNYNTLFLYKIVDI